MPIDYQFVVEVFQRYSNHLVDVVESIQTYQSNYKRQEEELIRLADYKPEVYQKELDKLREKGKQADIKLSYLTPRLTKMAEQIEEIKKLYPTLENVVELKSIESR